MYVEIVLGIVRIYIVISDAQTFSSSEFWINPQCAVFPNDVICILDENPAIFPAEK
jgi:hypothetical protein